jgi:hypothetical protein
MTPTTEHPSQGPGRLWCPETESDKAAVRLQLDRLLASPLFRNSKRYPALLSYVVGRVIEGRTDSVKERTLGIEVFNREPNYDTNQDPVVRTTAVEVRRRLVQYYQEPGRENEIRIEFHAGSYTPEIRMPASTAPVEHPAAEPEHPSPAPAAVQRARAASFWPIVGAAVLVLLAAPAFWWSHAKGSGSLERFWDPIWTSPDQVLVCVEATEDSSTADSGFHGAEPRVSFDDVTAVARVLGQKPDRTKSFRIRSEASIKFEDLREGPSVLIGGFGNRWTMRLLNQVNLRFRLYRNGDFVWIGDREKPDHREWLVNLAPSAAPSPEDFALISRVRDPSTGQIAVIAAGLRHFGTRAASEFLSVPKYMDEAVRAAGAGWEDKNLQVVLSTRLTGVNSGPPRILATYFW